MKKQIVKCPDCGMEMSTHDTNMQFYCSKCEIMFFNLVVDAEYITGDFVNMTSKEFENIIKGYTKKFFIRIKKVKISDIKDEIYNAKIKNAEKMLVSGCSCFPDIASYSYMNIGYVHSAVKNRENIYEELEEVPNTILSAERIRFLADCYVCSEIELANTDKDFYEYLIKHDAPYRDYAWIKEKKIINIDIENNVHFQNILKMADKETIESYKMIAKSWKNNVKKRKELDKKLEDIKSLKLAGSIDIALEYMKCLCNQYPFIPCCWGIMQRLVPVPKKRKEKKEYYNFIRNLIGKFMNSCFLMDRIHALKSLEEDRFRKW